MTREELLAHLTHEHGWDEQVDGEDHPRMWNHGLMQAAHREDHNVDEWGHQHEEQAA